MFIASAVRIAPAVTGAHILGCYSQIRTQSWHDEAIHLWRQLCLVASAMSAVHVRFEPTKEPTCMTGIDVEAACTKTIPL